MKREHIWLVVACLAFGAVMTPCEVAAQDLSVVGSQIVDELVDQWNTRFRSTDLALAMSNLGVPANDDLRLKVGEHLRANTSLARALRTWGANNYILSNDEKVIAKYLISFFEDKRQMPTLGEVAGASGVPREDLSARLEFMARAGFLKKSDDTSMGFSLGEDYETWGGPLRYNFHTVSVEGEKSFGVWWAVDFLLLVNSEYPDTKVTIEDSCAHCEKRIHLEIENGAIKTVEPDSVWIQQGGGWAVDNLFWSEEHLNEWLDEHPRYKQIKQSPIADFFEAMKAK